MAAYRGGGGFPSRQVLPLSVPLHSCLSVGAAEACQCWSGSDYSDSQVYRWNVRTGMHLSRDALHARSSGASTSYAADQSQVSINMPDAFDLDSEVEGLQGQLGRLKQVQALLVSGSVPCMGELSLEVGLADAQNPNLGELSLLFRVIITYPEYSSNLCSQVPDRQSRSLSCVCVECCAQVARAIGEENVLQSQAANSLVSPGNAV